MSNLESNKNDIKAEIKIAYKHSNNPISKAVLLFIYIEFLFPIKKYDVSKQDITNKDGKPKYIGFVRTGIKTYNPYDDTIDLAMELNKLRELRNLTQHNKGGTSNISYFCIEELYETIEKDSGILLP